MSPPRRLRHNSRLILPIDGPLDLRKTLFAARIGPTDPSVKFVADGVWRATRTPHGSATQRLRWSADGELEVDAWGAGAEWLMERTPALCGALDDAGSFQTDHPLVRNLARRHAGMRLGRTHAVFEATVGAVLEQRITTEEAWRNWRLLVRGLGEPAPGPLAGLWVPPAPETLARTPYYELHRFGIERGRADTLRRLGAVAMRLEESLAMAHDVLRQRLESIPGVGPWTSSRVALVARGDADAVCTGDLHLPHVVTWALAGEPRGSDERMLELLEPFRGHRARVQRLLLFDAVQAGRSEKRRYWQSK